MGALFVTAAATAFAAAVALARRDAAITCREGLVAAGPRCCVRAPSPGATGSCASSVGDVLAATARIHFGADAPLLRGESFERGRIGSTSVHVAPFFLAATEVSCGDAMAVLGSDASATTARLCAGDPARAAGGLRFTDAERVCAALGGRVPSEAEWQRAAGANGTRYPWGETGATCRVAVWSMERGPCGRGLEGPDTVRARPAGASPDGVWDLAGNVAEWVRAEDGPRVCGGHYGSLDAAEIRALASRPAPADEAEPHHGARCAFDSL